MNKKFFSGIIFGLAIGIGLSFAQPMLSKDLTITKSNLKTNKTMAIDNNQEKKDYQSNSNASKDETVALLKEIRDILKTNNQQSKEISEGIKTLGDRFKF